MGIAILGAVLQNRVTATITEGIQGVSQIPAALKDKIVAAASSGSMQFSIPEAGGAMPESARQMMEQLFMGWFTDAMASTFIVAVVLAAAGGLCALLLTSHVKDAAEGEAGAAAGPGGGSGPAAGETAVEGEPA
jgi:hypothetical protein